MGPSWVIAPKKILCLKKNLKIKEKKNHKHNTASDFGLIRATTCKLPRRRGVGGGTGGPPPPLLCPAQESPGGSVHPGPGQATKDGEGRRGLSASPSGAPSLPTTPKAPRDRHLPTLQGLLAPRSPRPPYSPHRSPKQNRAKPWSTPGVGGATREGSPNRQGFLVTRAGAQAHLWEQPHVQPTGLQETHPLLGRCM